MATDIILPFHKVDISKVIFSDPKPNKMNTKTVFINYERPGANLLVQTPKMSLPYGFSAFVDKASGKAVSFSVDFSFKFRETDDAVQGFYDTMTDFENHVLKIASENASKWFPGKKSMSNPENARDQYKASLKNHPLFTPPEEYKSQYPATFKTKVVEKRNEASDKLNLIVNVYDENRKPIDTTDLETLKKEIPPGSQAIGIFQPESVWFVNSGFGLKYRLRQLKVFKPRTIDGYCFISESTDDAADNDKRVDPAKDETADAESPPISDDEKNNVGNNGDANEYEDSD